MLHDRLAVRDGRQKAFPASAAVLSMLMSAMLFTAAWAQPAQDTIKDVPPAAIDAMGGADFAFSIVYNWRDEYWLGVQPSAKVRGRPADEELPATKEKVAEIQIWKYPQNSHCYTVIINGKATDVCPSH